MADALPQSTYHLSPL